jgi:hypothetical protein
MADLLLQPVGSSEYEVLAEGQVVGGLSLFVASKPGTPWMWSIDYAFHEGRHPTRGFEATREAAMRAFAKSWHRE